MQATLFDTTSRKHGGNKASTKAFERAKHKAPTWHQRIVLHLLKHGRAVLTDISNEPINKFSGRRTDLKDWGVIEDIPAEIVMSFNYFRLTNKAGIEIQRLIKSGESKRDAVKQVIAQFKSEYLERNK